LLELVRAGALRIDVVTRSWHDLDGALVDLEQRRFRGKMALLVD